MPDDLLQWYDSAAEKLSAQRAKKGLKAISGTELLKIVLARIAGLPVAHDVDLDAIKQAGKRAAKKGTTADMTTPPHGGRSAKKATAKKATAKKAPATDERWTRPHGG